MPKRQTNNLRWKAELLDIKTGTDGNDRPTTIYEFKRLIFYEELGVTSQENIYHSKPRQTLSDELKSDGINPSQRN